MLYRSKKVLIKNDNFDKINNWYIRLLQYNGYKIFYNQNISDWNVNLNLFPLNDNYQNDILIEENNCETIKFKNSINQLSILFTNRAYFCGAYSVIYKEISEINDLNNVITTCFILPEQINEFKEVSIALGKNVDWIVKTVYNSSLRNEFNFSKDQVNQVNQVNQFNHKPNLNYELNKLHYNYNLVDEYKNWSKLNKYLNNDLNDFNKNSIKFAIEIIDTYSGQVFRSKHHSNDILKTINFENFNLQKLNNSLVYVQKSIQLDPKSTFKSFIQKMNNQNSEIQNLNENTVSVIQKPFILHAFNKNGIQFLNQFNQFSNLVKQKQKNYNLIVLEKQISNLIQIKNNTFKMKQYILITNINPLRAYLYKEGLIFFVVNTTKTDFVAGFWFFSTFMKYIEKIHSKTASKTLEQNLIHTLSQFLLIAEFHLITNFKFMERFEFFDSTNFFSSKNRSKFKSKINCDQKCYQLIEVELVVTNDLKLFIVDVNLEYDLFETNKNQFKQFRKEYNKELSLFNKNLISSTWSVIGIISYPNLFSSIVSNNQKKNNFKRSIRIEDLPKKYIHILQRQNEYIRRKLLFSKTNKSNFIIKKFRIKLIRFLFKQNVGIIGLNCLIVHQLCLNDKDLEHLFLINIELFYSSGTYKMLYPSVFMHKMNELIEHLNNKILSTYINLKNGFHRTHDLHNFIYNLQQDIYSEASLINRETNFSIKEEKISNLQHNLPKSSDLNNTSNNVLDVQDYYFYSSNSYLNTTIAKLNLLLKKDLFLNVSNCSLNLEDLNRLSLLRFEPNITSLNYLNYEDTHFQITVHFNIIKLRLIASVAYCQDRIKFLNNETPYLNVSLNLGIGLNKISFTIISYVQHSKLTNYYFWIYRQNLDELSTYSLNSSSNQLICQINQNCNFILYTNNTCNLSYIDKLKNASNTIESLFTNMSLPFCKGDEPGRWLIKCNDCANRFSCDQSSQTWLPYSCRYRTFNTFELQQCFKNKNVMFIGDSTNRGIIHHLIEKINNSLYSYEKTHNTKVYTNLNNHQTTFAFSYYPQFWKGQNMPSLSASLMKLINLVYDKHKRENVFVIGGVHWLSTKHINLLYNLIQSIPNVKLVLKSLGSGFHQRVNDVHYLSINSQRKFVDHNKNLVSFALKKNITILDTFNITNFVYDAFYPGKCSCHFYKVKKNQNGTYFIEGLVNSLYTSMITNLICN